MSHVHIAKLEGDEIMKLFKTALMSLMLATPLAVLAQSTATPGFDQRQANQEQRIQQGVSRAL